MWIGLSQERSLTMVKNIEKVTHELTSQQAVDSELAPWKTQSKKNSTELLQIPTGFFIQSIYFESANNILISGYIWQKYTLGKHDHVARGFIMPESIKSAGSAVTREIYRKKEGNNELIGWYFERVINQNFKYTKFPLDFKTVWIRLWHQDFYRNIVLVPDLNSYDSTKVSDNFGIDADIVLSGWSMINTFFSYSFKSYDTNFGFNDYIGKNDFPELHYNLLLKRKIINPLIVYIAPMLVVLTLLFAVLMTTSSNKDSIEKSGFTILESYASYTGLLFVILLAHIDLRNKLPVNSIFYIEYFYIMLYLIILLLTFNTHFTLSKAGSLGGCPRIETVTRESPFEPVFSFI